MRRSLPLYLFACPQLLTCARSSLTAHSHTDYYGEPPVGGATGEGEVSSTYGQYDLCGFPKAGESERRQSPDRSSILQQLYRSHTRKTNVVAVVPDCDCWEPNYSGLLVPDAVAHDDRRWP